MTQKSNARRFGAIGVVFGMGFPLFATVLVVASRSMDASLGGAMAAQSTEPLLWFIDCAPLFFGVTGYFAGVVSDEAERTMDSLKQEVRGRTESLERERADLRRADAQGALTAARMEGILKSSVDSIVLIGQSGAIELVNHATVRAFGYPLEALIGQNVKMLMPERDRTRHDGYLHRYLNTGEARIIGQGRLVEGLRADGTTFPLHLSITEHASADGVTFLGVMRDMTIELQAARERERRTFEDRLLHRVISLANGSEDTDVALAHCTQTVCELTGWPIGHVYTRDLVDPDKLLPTSTWTVPDEDDFFVFVDATTRTTFQRGEGLPGRILASSKPAWIANVHNDDNFPRARHFKNIKVKGAFGFPILVDGAVLAVLEFFSSEEIEEDRDLLRVAENVGIQVGRVLEKIRVREDLFRAKEAAEVANRTKSNFLANMSHELRTPLGATIGFTNVLLKNKAENLTKRDILYLGRVRANGMHLLKLINEILDIAKVESGQMALNLGPCDVSALIVDVASLQESLALERGLDLRLELPPRLRPVLMDETRLKQAVINLVGNAIKFTHTGSVTIRALTYADTESLQGIEVVDTGIGIPEAERDLVFGAFRQGEESTQRKYGGTGLGLTLTRRFCESMGLSLSVESAVGQGSTFRIGVPLDKTIDNALSETFSTEETLILPPAGLAHPPGRVKRVLVIDDDEDALLLTTELLAEHSLEVRVAQNGAEGLRVAKEWRPDLILLDLMMPVMDGWDLLGHLRTDPLLAQIPVVVVSAHGDSSRDRLGGIALIQKPIERDVVTAMLGLRSDSPRALIVDDKTDARERMRVLVTELGWEAHTAASGQEALDLLGEMDPSVVFLDYMMPVMDGAMVLAKIGERHGLDNLPVVIVTSTDPGDAELDRMNNGAWPLLRKGEHLAEEVSRLLGSLDSRS